MPLPLEQAQAIIKAALARAVTMGVQVSIAVVDQGGHLVALARMDGAGFLSPEIARGKAFAAAAFRRNTAELVQRAKNNLPFYAGLGSLSGGRLIPSTGGIPIAIGDEVVGAIGVSGGKGEEDEEIALIGLGAVTSPKVRRRRRAP